MRCASLSARMVVHVRWHNRVSTTADYNRLFIRQGPGMMSSLVDSRPAPCGRYAEARQHLLQSSRRRCIDPLVLTLEVGRGKGGKGEVVMLQPHHLQGTIQETGLQPVPLAAFANGSLCHFRHSCLWHMLYSLSKRRTCTCWACEDPTLGRRIVNIEMVNTDRS